MGAYIEVRLVTGKWLTLQRMAIFPRMEFAHHLKQAYRILNEDKEQKIRELYERNDEFRHHCDNCLRLHNIPPNELSDDQFIAFLFGSKSHPFGVLNQFNFDISDCTGNAKSPEVETKGSILGKLFRATNDIPVALKMAETMPVDVLEDMFAELKPEEEKYKDLARNAISRVARPGD